MITIGMKLEIPVKCFYYYQIVRFTQLSQYKDASTETVTLVLNEKDAEHFLFRRESTRFHISNGYVISIKFDPNYNLNGILIVDDIHRTKDDNPQIYVIDDYKGLLKNIEDEYIKYRVAEKLANISDSEIYDVIQSKEVIDEFDINKQDEEANKHDETQVD